MVYGRMGQEGKSIDRVKFQTFRKVQSMKAAQIRRIQAKKCFPERSVSAPDFSRD
jgi:hypothetical protein